MNQPPRYDDSPDGLCRSLYALASLIEFFIDVEGEGRALNPAEVEAALAAYPGGGDTPEEAAFAKLPPPVRHTVAEGFEVAMKEFLPVVRGAEGDPKDIPAAVTVAQGKIRGGLRIVEKLAGGLPGWIGEIWDIHVRHL